MTQSEYNEAKQHLLTAFNILAPDRAAQQGAVRVVHEAEEDGQEPRQVCTALVAALSDGLFYGNWPKGNQG